MILATNVAESSLASIIFVFVFVVEVEEARRGFSALDRLTAVGRDDLRKVIFSRMDWWVAGVEEMSTARARTDVNAINGAPRTFMLVMAVKASSTVWILI